MKSFHIVVAATAERGIGINGTLPWRIKEDVVDTHSYIDMHNSDTGTHTQTQSYAH